MCLPPIFINIKKNVVELLAVGFPVEFSVEGALELVGL